MKPEIKKQWVAALRSGEYKQGKSALRFGDEFCCLGVLCDLHAKETGGTWTRTGRVRYTYDGCGALLPLLVSDWADCESGPFITKIVEGYTTTNSLTDMNDNGSTFLQIADAIEQDEQL